MERNRSRKLRGFLIGLLAGLVLASAGVASARGGGHDRVAKVTTPPTEVPVPSDECAVDLGDLEESAEGEESEEACPSELEEEEEGEAEDEGEDEGDATDGDRQAECEQAAGLSDEDGEESESEVKSTGLDHAIEVVMANCLKNPQAPGLLNALRHLAENRERKAARDEAKAERKAARDEAKAERKAAHAGSGKGHGKGKKH